MTVVVLVSNRTQMPASFQVLLPSSQHAGSSVLMRIARRSFTLLHVAVSRAADDGDQAYPWVNFGKKTVRISLVIRKTSDRRSPVITVGIIRMIELANHHGVWMGRNVI